MELGQYTWDPERDLIAHGAFAEVFKAQDTNSQDRVVALKIYKEAVAKGTVSGHSLQKKYSLEREFEQICALSHTNIISFYGINYILHEDMMGRSSSYPVIVMEYATDGTLIDFLKTRPEQGVILKLIKDIISGLSYLHSEGLVHRDLKPANVLVSRNRRGEPVAKITDFGISRDLLTEKTIEQSMTEGVGTPHYMAPEQFFKKKFGLNGEISERTDFWGLGVIIYWLLSGKLPFGHESKDYEYIRDQIINQEPDLSAIPSDFWALVKGCLAKHAGDRFATIQDVYSQLPSDSNEDPLTVSNPLPDLRTHVSGSLNTGGTSPVSKRPGTKAGIPSKPARKNRLRKVLVAAIIVLVAGGAVGYYVLYQKRITRQYEEELTKGEDFLRGAMYDSSLARFDKALTLRQPDSTRSRREMIHETILGLSDFYDADYESAVLHFKKAETLGSGAACYYLGELAYNGLGMAEDEGLGWEYTRKALDRDFGMAKWRYATNLRDGTGGIEIDVDKSDEMYLEVAEILKELAENGDPEAQGNLGVMYSSGRGVPENNNLATKWYTRAAEQGYTFIQVNLGQQYYGKGEYGSAYKWFKRASDKGEARGMYNLGVMYRYGDSVETNWNEAKKWLLEAAEKEYQAAFNELGTMYFVGGEGDFKRDYSEALKWYEQAGDEYYFSLFGRGRIYMLGDNRIQKDYKKSAELYEKSLELRKESVVYEDLGILYQLGGNNLARNTNKAISYHKLSGTGESAYQLYRIYSARSNTTEAVKWLRKGITLGHKKSIDRGVELVSSVVYYYKNTFDKRDDHFSNTFDDDFSYYLSGGLFHIQGKAEKYTYYSWSFHNDLDITKDYTVSVDVKYISGGEGNPIGLVFGSKDFDNINWLGISSYGGYLFVGTKDGRGTYSMDKWAPNKARKGSVSNTLKVVRSGSYFKIYINDEYIAQHYQPHNFGSRFGLFVGEKVRAQFDNFLVTGSKK